ncbi:TonB-dependent receptor [Pseudoxanthomonas wuyuanensis]|nr:TonB-dependent receptor [Pseudoxanthomonas wuyuanensis]KAF1718763.1 TonB-dependent receptor [Pseudoxanthomonas wuyuanensis]
MLALVSAPQAMAQQRSFDVPAQPAVNAIPEFARQAGVQIVAPAGSLQGVDTPAVSGEMDVREALKKLLEGTTLEIQSDDGNIITLRDKSATRTATAAAPAAQAIDLETIEVTGSYAGSLSEQSRFKRYADNVVDVIAAEDIGKLPAQNVAEALQRVTGVAITRDRGEGVYVRVRGLGPNFQITTLNGQTMAVNENVRTSGQTGRQFRYDTLPAELVSGLEVIKSPSANLDEGAIGGIVNVRTFKPLQLGKTMFSGSLENSHPELADENDPRVSGLFNWVSADNTFGFLVSAAHSIRHTRQDRVNEVGWNAPTDSVPYYVMTSFRPTLELEKRERTGVSAAFQWRPTDRFDLNLDLFYARQKVNYDEYALGISNLGYATMNDVQTSNGAVTSFSTDVAEIQIGRETSGITDENKAANLNGKWIGDLWTFSGTAFRSTADSWDSDPIRRTRFITGKDTSISVVVPIASGDNVPSLSFASYDPTDAGGTPGRRLEFRTIDVVDKESALQFDADRALDSSFFRNLKAGVKYRERSRDYQRRDPSNKTSGIAGVYFDDSHFTSLPVSDFLSGANGSLPNSWLAPIEDPFWAGWPTDADFDAMPKAGDLQNSYTIDEEITSGYLMTDFDHDLAGRPLRGNVGVRLSRTRSASDGHSVVDGATTPVHFEKDYTNVLPSLNAAWDLRDDMVLRGAAAKVITRPDLTDMSPKLTFNSGTTLTASGGNPNLDPYEAWQYDLSWEWYIDKTSALTAGLFYKDISSFIQTQKSYFDYQGQTYLLSAKTNGSQASVKGAELAWQQVFAGLPAPLDGLGMQLNYTWTDSEAEYHDGDETFTDALEGVAKNSYNATLFYEKGPFAARVSYSWLDDVVNSVGNAGLATLNSDDFGSLDASVSWKVSDQLSVFANAINLTGEVQRQYVGNHLFGGYTDYGRTWSLGLRARF